MTAISLDERVSDLVRHRPARARVFEKLRIDFCCDGGASLRQACSKRDLDPDKVLAQIVLDDEQPRSPAPDIDAMSLTELADHIEATHHAYLREELPRIDRMSEKVARVHGGKEPRLLDVRRAFLEFQQEVLPHLMKEEMVLFPYLRRLEAEGAAAPAFHCGSVEAPIRQMEHEHEQAGAALRTMNEATDGFVPPEWACNTYRALLDAIAAVEKDMHLHVHAENYVLFPKGIEKYETLFGSR